jgi:hypothetical protein
MGIRMPLKWNFHDFRTPRRPKAAAPISRRIPLRQLSAADALHAAKKKVDQPIRCDRIPLEDLRVHRKLALVHEPRYLRLAPYVLSWVELVCCQTSWDAICPGIDCQRAESTAIARVCTRNTNGRIT